MPLAPKFMKLLAEKIVAGLPNDRIEAAVLGATGYGLYAEFAAPGDSMNRAIYKALEQLNGKGNERWLLTYLLVQSVANDELSRLIVDVNRESLVPALVVDAQVQRVIDNLATVAAAALAPDYRSELAANADALPGVSQQISTLLAYKSLHECLHALQMQLGNRSTSDTASPRDLLIDLSDCRTKMALAAEKARNDSAALGWSPDAIALERAWIAELEDHATQMQSILTAAEGSPSKAQLDPALIIFDDVQSLGRQHLVRLNQRLFDTASGLSLADLITAMPLLIQVEDYFEQFKYSILDLSPTVLARALVHKIWQDADKEISLIEDILDAPATGANRFREHWVTLRRRVLWLAKLESEAEWAKKAAEQAENIDDGLADNASDETIRPHFEALRSFAKYRFFAVDDALRKDCDSLCRINAPLMAMIEEIRNG